MSEFSDAPNLDTWQDFLNYTIKYPHVEGLYISTKKFVNLEVSISDLLFERFHGFDDKGPFVRIGRMKVRPHTIQVQVIVDNNS